MPFCRVRYSRDDVRSHVHAEANGASLLLSIPPELLQHIGRCTSKRYDYQRRYSTKTHDNRDLIAHSDLTSLASTSRAIRDVLFPQLFSELNLGSSARLRAFAKAPKHIHALVRSLCISLDLTFYESWLVDLEHYRPSPSQSRSSTLAVSLSDESSHTSPSTTSHHNPPLNLLHALSTILVQSSKQLHRFSFVMHPRHPTGGSVWSQFPRPGMTSLPWASRLVPALRDCWRRTTTLAVEGQYENEDLNREALHGALAFPMLQRLCLDGTADVSEFVQLTPNLAALRLRIPEGFNASDCHLLASDALPHVPKLKSLELWMWELGAGVDERREVLGGIAKACPELRRLSFQTRTFDYADGGLDLRPVSHRRFDWQDIIAILPDLPCLTELRLPGSLYEKNEQRAHLAYAGRNMTANVGNAATATDPGTRAEARSTWRGVVNLANWALGRPSAASSPTASASAASSSPTTIATPPVSGYRRGHSRTSSFEALLETIITRERITSAQLMLSSSSSRLQCVSWVREEGAEAIDYVLNRQTGDVELCCDDPELGLDEDEDYRSYAFDDAATTEMDWRDLMEFARVEEEDRKKEKEGRGYRLDDGTMTTTPPAGGHPTIDGSTHVSALLSDSPATYVTVGKSYANRFMVDLAALPLFVTFVLLLPWGRSWGIGCLLPFRSSASQSPVTFDTHFVERSAPTPAPAPAPAPTLGLPTSSPASKHSLLLPLVHTSGAGINQAMACAVLAGSVVNAIVWSGAAFVGLGLVAALLR